MASAESLLDAAIETRASDIHIDPLPEGFRVRMRVDGRFREHGVLDRPSGERLLGRLKVLASLMVYRSDIPQEGRLAIAGEREARIALIPTPLGERGCLRLFDPDARLARLEDLELPGDALAWFRARLAEPQGLLLVVGPSGSGKTTTLYAALAEVLSARGDFSQVVTVEDPVERRIPGCVQVQADASRDLDFPAALKFLLRQDPEVILVGEIRDAETARVAVRAAMTGHLVLSSLHCARATEARARLLEMGVERYALDLALHGVSAQRLVRRRCVVCAGAGCDTCFGTGYRGRLPLMEVLDARDEAPARDLFASGAAEVRAGRTTEEEVRRVLGSLS